MTYQFYFKRPIAVLELKLNMIIDINPHLINALYRNNSHPFIENTLI